jgi:hypothetical protein
MVLEVPDEIPVCNFGGFSVLILNPRQMSGSLLTSFPEDDPDGRSDYPSVFELFIKLGRQGDYSFFAKFA